MISVQLYLIGALAISMSVTGASKPNPGIYYTVAIDPADWGKAGLHRTRARCIQRRAN